jgi:spore germination protein GerM
MPRTLAACLAAAAVMACDGPETGDPSPGGPVPATADSTPGASSDAQSDTGTRNVRGAGTGNAGSTATAALTIFFSRGESAVAVSREAPAEGPALEAALRQLLRGPTASERSAGMHSWFSDTTAGALRSVDVDVEGGAVVDFADLRELIPNASTSAGSAMLLRELNATVFAVPAVQSVEYRIEGSCDQFWEWLQYDCQVVARP